MILNKKYKDFTVTALFSRILLLVALFMVSGASQANGSKLAQDKPHILVYGDSLSAAYGMDEEKGWVNLLSQSLAATHKLTNASISGETSSGGLARLRLTLNELSPDLVLLELGANDGLNGYSTELLKNNLDAMIRAIKDSGAQTVLGSISLPPSYGPRYIDSFRSVYSELASEHALPLLDLYQQSFVETPGFIQEDGLHPTEVTQPIIRDLVLNFLHKNKLILSAGN